MASLLQDLRYGVRMLRKSRGFSVVAVIVLALGIGSRAAICSVVDRALRLIVGQGMRLAALGLLVGLTASMAIPGLMSGLLFGVSARDPWGIFLVAGLLSGVALVANAVPAQRATRVEPLAGLALRVQRRAACVDPAVGLYQE